MLELGEQFIAKKLNPTNVLDKYIAESCCTDPSIREYMELKDVFANTSYLNRTSIYQSQYGLYLGNTPIGYLDISKIYISEMDEWVNLMYAILKEHRNKGYAKKIVNAITREILIDRLIKSVHLQISCDNTASIHIAKSCNFMETSDDQDLGYKTYIKAKWMLEKEKTL